MENIIILIFSGISLVLAIVLLILADRKVRTSYMITSELEELKDKNKELVSELFKADSEYNSLAFQYNSLVDSYNKAVNKDGGTNG